MSTENDSDLKPNIGCIDGKEKYADKSTSEDVKTLNSKVFLKRMVNSLAILTIVLLCTLLGVTIAWYVVRVKGLTPREHEICLPCGELKGHYDNDEVLDQFRKEKDQCCAKTSTILKRLVDKTTTEKYSSDLSNNFFASSNKDCKQKIPEKPAARVAGISFLDMKQDHAKLMVHWNISSEQSFFKQNVKYVRGSLQVEKAGFYYIFNQMKWFLNDSDTFPIKHEIVLQSQADGPDKILLEGRKSRCNLVEETGETTSSIGAMFELKELDRVFVTTSRPEDLAPCHHANFFGLYQVADTLND